jgi:hypothetical protein
MSIILTAQAVEIRRITVRGQPGQKVGKTPSQPTSLAWWGALVIHYVRVTGRTIIA